MSSESIPVGLRSLLAKHYFLAQITRGYKPCLSKMTLVNSSSWTGALYRFIHGETRKTGITDIENIISETVDSINTHKKNLPFLKLIINAMASTRVGIESMIITYRDDPAMIGRIRVQLTEIDLQLEKHRELIKGYIIDDDMIEDVVNATETDDKEGLRQFLKGKDVNGLLTSDVNKKSPLKSDCEKITTQPTSNIPRSSRKPIESNEQYERQRRQRRQRTKQSTEDIL